MKPDLVERFLLDECTSEIKRRLEIEIDEMISGKGPTLREHNFNLYDLRLDAVRKKVRILDIFDPGESGRLELEMFHFRTLLKRLTTHPTSHTTPFIDAQRTMRNRRGSRVLDFIASSAKKLSPKKHSTKKHSQSETKRVNTRGSSIKNKIMKTRGEKYIKLDTDPVLPKRVRSLGLVDGINRVTLLLEEAPQTSFDFSPTDPKGKTVTLPRFSISFSKQLCYRRTDEGNRLRMLATMDPAVLASSGYGLFEVQNSEFFRWFDKESYNRYEDRAPRHFSLITTREVYDILSYKAPVITETANPDTASEGISLWDLF